VADQGANAKESQPGRQQSHARRDLLWGLIAFTTFVIVSIAILIAFSPRARSALQGPPHLSLTIVHTNDTWGYLDPCG